MKKRTKTKAVSPSEAKSSEIAYMESYNFETKDCCIMRDGEQVYIAKQAKGSLLEKSISMDRRTFNKLIKWWITPQKMRR